MAKTRRASKRSNHRLRREARTHLADARGRRLPDPGPVPRFRPRDEFESLPLLVPLRSRDILLDRTTERSAPYYERKKEIYEHNERYIADVPEFLGSEPYESFLAGSSVAIPSSFGSGNFDRALQTAVCAERQERKEVLFATGKAGRTGRKNSPVYTRKSRVKCG